MKISNLTRLLAAAKLRLPLLMLVPLSILPDPAQTTNIKGIVFRPMNKPVPGVTAPENGV
jgi:hypothetical protein